MYGLRNIIREEISIIISDNDDDLSSKALSHEEDMKRCDEIMWKHAERDTQIQLTLLDDKLSDKEKVNQLIRIMDIEHFSNHGKQ